MKPNGLPVALGVLIALGGVVWWTNKHPKKDEPATPAAPKILSLGEDKIETLRIAKSGAEPIVLKKIGGTWEIAGPKAMHADQDAVKSLTAAAASLTADRLIDEQPTSLTGFGLANSPEEIDITEKGGTVNRLLLGSDTPAGSDTYAKLASKAAVYTIPTASKTAFDRTINDLRDKRLLPFNADKLTSVSIASKGPAFELARNGQNEWQIAKPKPMRADSMQVDDFVRKLKDAKMDVAEDPAKAAADFKSAAKIGIVSVTDNSGTQTLELRQAADKSYYAKSSAAEGPYKLAGDLGDGLKDKHADSFRNKKLFEFGFSDLSKLEVNGTIYQKSAEKWTGPNGAQYDPASVQNVIDKLRDLAASRFIEKATGTQALTLAVTSGDTHKVEKVMIDRNADAYTARRDGDPSIYALDPKSSDELLKAVSGIRLYQAPKNEKKK